MARVNKDDKVIIQALQNFFLSSDGLVPTGFTIKVSPSKAEELIHKKLAKLYTGPVIEMPPFEPVEEVFKKRLKAEGGYAKREEFARK